MNKPSISADSTAGTSPTAAPEAKKRTRMVVLVTRRLPLPPRPLWADAFAAMLKLQLELCGVED